MLYAVVRFAEKKEKPQAAETAWGLGFLAERVGFEPTCPCGQLHFECSSL